MLSISQNHPRRLINTVIKKSFKRNHFQSIYCNSIRFLSGGKKNNEEPTTEEYLSSLGYDDVNVQNGMKDALKAAFGNNITVGNLKSLGKDGK